MIFIIGPDGSRDIYEIEDALKSWILRDWIPTCTHCHKQLHLEFDMQIGAGTAECRCNLEISRRGERREFNSKRKFVRIK
jgi:hypothetical protein